MICFKSPENIYRINPDQASGEPDVTRKHLTGRAFSDYNLLKYIRDISSFGQKLLASLKYKRIFCSCTVNCKLREKL